VSASATVTGPADVNLCPSCGGTSGVRVRSGASPGVRAWSCVACRTDWAITVVNPRPQLFLDRLTVTVVLRQVIALAQEAPGLSEDQLRARLAGLARVARSAAVTDFPFTCEATIGHRLRDAPANQLPVADRPHH
jgi:hypothetical protein